MNFWKTHHQFLSLPPEIRNRIYEFLLVSPTISILNLSDEEYKKRKKKRKSIARSTYPIKDPQLPMYPSGPADLPARHGISDQIITTYVIDRKSTKNIPCMTTLCLNRQIYQEASEILYGSETFWFEQSSALAPFLQDRPPMAIQSLSKFRISLTLAPRDW